MRFVPDQSPHNQDACPDGQLLIRHIVQPWAVSEADSQRLVDHLFVCPRCSDLYGALCDVAEQFHEEKAEAEGNAEPVVPVMTNEAAVADIWRRIEVRERQSNRGRHRQRLLRIARMPASIAACLLLVVGVLWWNHSTTQRAKPAEIASARQPLPGNKIAASGDNPLGDMSSLFIPEPLPFDPATTDYEKGLRKQEEFVVAAHPWIVSARNALNARGIQADCLDVLMVSGGFQQFNFDPKQPIGQPLAMYEPVAMRRLAEYYQVPTAAFNSGGDDISVASISPATVALRQWRSAVLATAGSGSQVDLFLYTRRTVPYLAQTNAVAGLWVHHHPQQAQTLLASGSYRSACQIPPTVHDAEAWGQLLAKQAAAATRCIQAVNGLLRMPTWERCAVEASAPWRQFRQDLDEVAPTGIQEDGQ